MLYQYPDILYWRIVGRCGCSNPSLWPLLCQMYSTVFSLSLTTIVNVPILIDGNNVPSKNNSVYGLTSFVCNC